MQSGAVSVAREKQDGSLQVAYVTFFIPLLLMLALLVKALSAAGGEAMIRSLFDTNWDHLLNQEVNPLTPTWALCLTFSHVSAMGRRFYAKPLRHWSVFRRLYHAGIVQQEGQQSRGRLVSDRIRPSDLIAAPADHGGWPSWTLLQRYRA